MLIAACSSGATATISTTTAQPYWQNQHPKQARLDSYTTKQDAPPPSPGMPCYLAGKGLLLAEWKFTRLPALTANCRLEVHPAYALPLEYRYEYDALQKSSALLTSIFTAEKPVAFIDCSRPPPSMAPAFANTESIYDLYSANRRRVLLSLMAAGDHHSCPTGHLAGLAGAAFQLILSAWQL